jgi:hypothetical protein
MEVVVCKKDVIGMSLLHTYTPFSFLLPSSFRTQERRQMSFPLSKKKRSDSAARSTAGILQFVQQQCSIIMMPLDK